MSDAISRNIVFDGTAKPRPLEFEMIAVVIPMTSPL